MKKFKDQIQASSRLRKDILAYPDKYYPQFERLWKIMKKADAQLDAVAKRIDWDDVRQPDSRDAILYDKYVHIHNDALTKIKEMVADLPGGSEEQVVSYLNSGEINAWTFWKLCLGQV